MNIVGERESENNFETEIENTHDSVATLHVVR